MNCPIEVVVMGCITVDDTSEWNAAQCKKLTWLMDNDYIVTQRNTVCMGTSLYAVIWLEHQPIEKEDKDA